MRYLGEAFWAKIDVPLLGSLPINAVALLAFALLGFGEPAFWPLGIGLETAFLFILSTNPRFQKWVDARDLHPSELQAHEQWSALVKRLDDAQLRRMQKLDEKCERIRQIYHDQQVDEFTASTNSDALRQMQWIYLKLLVAQHYINDSSTVSDPDDLHYKIKELQDKLKLSGLTDALRSSTESTLRLLQQRLTNMNRRAQTSEEIESELARVEAQVDLALESSALQGQTAVITSNLDLASHLFDSSSFGDLSETVSAIDQTFTPTSPPYHEKA